MRYGATLAEAMDRLEKDGVNIWSANTNPTQSIWTKSPKAYASVYIDDSSLGCPLMPGAILNREMVDWYQVMLDLDARFPDTGISEFITKLHTPPTA